MVAVAVVVAVVAVEVQIKNYFTRMVQTVEKSAPFLQIKSWSKLIQGWITIKTRTKHEKTRKITQKCLHHLFNVVWEESKRK